MKKARRIPVELPAGMETTSLDNDSGELDSDTPVPLTVISNDNRLSQSGTARPKARPRKSSAAPKRATGAKRSGAGLKEPAITAASIEDAPTIVIAEEPKIEATPVVPAAPRSVFYDMKFTFGLIALVVGVNILLALLINHTPSREPTSAPAVAEAPAPLTEGHAFTGDQPVPPLPAPPPAIALPETPTPEKAVGELAPAAGSTSLLSPPPLVPPQEPARPAQDLITIIDRP